MQNRKKILIEMLTGSVAALKELPEAIKGIDVYDETGHVDNDFLISALTCVNEFMDASNLVVQSITSMIAPDGSAANDKKKVDDTGAKWDAAEILKHCTLESGVLKLPQVQFNRKSYAEAKRWIEEAGGSWQGGQGAGLYIPIQSRQGIRYLA